MDESNHFDPCTCKHTPTMHARKTRGFCTLDVCDCQGHPLGGRLVLLTEPERCEAGCGCPRCPLSDERLSQMRDDLTVVWNTGTDRQAALDGLTLLDEVNRLRAENERLNRG